MYYLIRVKQSFHDYLLLLLLIKLCKGSLGATRYFYTIAMCVGMEDRWMVGVGQPVCATVDPQPPICGDRRVLDMSPDKRSVCVFVTLSIWLVSRSIPTEHICLLPYHPSGGKRRETEVVPLSKKPGIMTSDPCHPPIFSNLQSYPSPQPVCIYSYNVSMTTVTFHPLAQDLTSVIN